MVDGNGVKLVTREKTEGNEPEERQDLEADYGDATAREVALALLRYRPNRGRTVKRKDDE